MAPDVLGAAAARADLGHEPKATTVRAAVLEITPSFSAEAGLSSNWRIMREQERQRFVEGVGEAGLPVCTNPAAAAALASRDRLPACEAERSKAAAATPLR